MCPTGLKCLTLESMGGWFEMLLALPAGVGVIMIAWSGLIWMLQEKKAYSVLIGGIVLIAMSSAGFLYMIIREFFKAPVIL